MKDRPRSTDKTERGIVIKNLVDSLRNFVTIFVKEIRLVDTLQEYRLLPQPSSVSLM